MNPTTTKTATAKPAAKPAATPATKPATATPAATAPTAPVKKADPIMYTGTAEKPVQKARSVVIAEASKGIKGLNESLVRQAWSLANSGAIIPPKLDGMKDEEYKALELLTERLSHAVDDHTQITRAFKAKAAAESAQKELLKEQTRRQAEIDKARRDAEKKKMEESAKKVNEYALKSIDKMGGAAIANVGGAINDFLSGLSSEGVKITAQGAQIDVGLKQNQSIDAMVTIVKAQQASQNGMVNATNFALGDVINNHVIRWGETHVTALASIVEESGLSISHVRKYPVIAKVFPLESGVRFPGLKWGHFQEAVSQSAEKGDKLISPKTKAKLEPASVEKLNAAFFKIQCTVLTEANEGHETTIWVRQELRKRKLALYAPYSQSCAEAKASDEAKAAESEGAEAPPKAKKNLFIYVREEGAPMFSDKFNEEMADAFSMVMDTANKSFRRIDQAELGWQPMSNGDKTEHVKDSATIPQDDPDAPAEVTEGDTPEPDLDGAGESSDNTPAVDTPAEDTDGDLTLLD